MKKSASGNVSFEGLVNNKRFRLLMVSASAFIFAAEEYFGIVVVEPCRRALPCSPIVAATFASRRGPAVVRECSPSILIREKSRTEFSLIQKKRTNFFTRSLMSRPPGFLLSVFGGSSNNLST
jgi:hypothetical protein